MGGDFGEKVGLDPLRVQSQLRACMQVTSLHSLVRKSFGIILKCIKLIARIR